MSYKSVEAFLNVLNSEKRRTDIAKIYMLIDEFPDITIKQMKSKLFMENKHNVLTARLSELEDLGLVYSKSIIGHNQSLYYIEKDADKIALNAKRRNKLRVDKWLSKGFEFSSFLPHILMEELKKYKHAT